MVTTVASYMLSLYIYNDLMFSDTKTREKKVYMLR
jgi:hypothetical protein